MEQSERWETEKNKNHETLRSHINMMANFSIVVMIAVSGWQLFLLNRFFR